MVFNLKIIVSRNTYLFTAWYHLIRKHRGVSINYFSKDTTLYIDGYPRSGNTFLIHLCKDVFPNQNLVHHLHAIAPIKIALKKNVPTIILFRDPLNAISSRYLKELAMKDKHFSGKIDDKKLKEYILRYISYNTFVIENIDNILLVNFLTLVNNPQIVLSKISKFVEHQKEINTSQVLTSQNTYRGATDTLGSSKPNPIKERYKKQIIKRITEFDEFHILKHLEKELTSINHV